MCFQSHYFCNMKNDAAVNMIDAAGNGTAGSGTGERESFLDSVARAYAENFSDMSEFCFVFPNKRSGTFFLKSLSNMLGNRVLLAPEVLSVSDFVENVSGRGVATRIDMLFRLFNIYKGNRSLIPGSVQGDELLEFDAFRSWGEILLSDFSEVDQYNVDPDAIFANVSDYREIASNFLTPDQLEILERYFGYTPNYRDVERFWKNLVPPKGNSSIKERFMYLWQAMAPLYHALDENLAAEGLATPGGVYRVALQRIQEKGRELFEYKKIVFVGFNALSTAEALIFEEISKAGGYHDDEKESFADFYWDATGPVLESPDSDAAAFLRLDKRNFPSPGWALPYLERNRVETMPSDMRVIASPSNSAQTKIAASRVRELVELVGADDVRDARVAVVLPDENLLFPLLYALPESLSEVNLTMGYSLRLTSVASFLHHLRQLHARSRKRDGETAYFHEDVRMLLSHPFAHALLGSRNVSELNSDILNHHRLVVTMGDMMRVVKNGSVSVLDMESFGTGTKAGIRYIDNVLAHIDAALADEPGGVVKSRIDRSHIALYRDALRRLEWAAAEHGIEMGLQGVFYMVDKLLSGERVTFEGEPLEGLQVMGLLETRALDFDHLVILSLNDRIMPRKARKATFIPDSLRHGYGLPYSNYQERLFAYYFYRMISRAKSVTLIYDARSGEGMRSGGESRYLRQLRYLYARNGIRYENYRFMLSDTTPELRPVEKTSSVMADIMEFARPGSHRNFSASALRKYGECQVKFYYEVIANLKTDTDSGDYIDPITQGNIIHDTMLCLYFPEKDRKLFLVNRILMTAERLSSMLEDTGLIRRHLRRSINKEHFKKKGEELDDPIEGAAAMVARQLEGQIRDILRYDLSLAPFELAGGEMTGLYEWEFSPGRKVNMKYAIDRLDVLSPGTAAERWRIVDYKTGGSLVAAEEFEDIFNGEYSAKNLFQLLLYANLLNLDRGMDEDVKVSIYEVGRIVSDGEVTPKIGKEKLDGHKQVNAEFLSRVNGMIEEIFDPMVPFSPAEDESHCRFCHLHDLCGRN